MPKIKYGDIDIVVSAGPKDIAHRIEVAVRYIADAQGYDGEHHKVWFLNQALSSLLGEEQYKDFVEQYNRKYYKWDEGVAP